ncbi:hypothetical protein [Aphanothece sacrum]|uniref:Uncharacterized protein n=1 Tax=Aphanothece sacrum FPU1 TaxID=1920663 RepID=A0A401ILJ3_APHSA|nr:hypothetical protein [Aphanothece sacrum]GBF82108.1 hypothetical protein AsFPU1_3535 [Aphanothece sacrum FPU1]GBF85042.1 hypothetical protein AsFPU3_2098 [Aphanothece sacrum FPU3]
MTYTTQQLIKILDSELRATWKGERVILSCEDRIDNPVIAKALNMEKMGKVFAYQDFRRQIHKYQIEHQVSGIIWRECHYQNRSLSYPELHNQLIAVPGDKETLIEAKKSVINFWWDMTEGMNFWLSAHRHRPISLDSLEDFVQEVEWAEIDAARTELYLGLCWGNPQEYQYQWAKPNSGCHRIIAALDEPSSIKV